MSLSLQQEKYKANKKENQGQREIGTNKPKMSDQEKDAYNRKMKIEQYMKRTGFHLSSNQFNKEGFKEMLQKKFNQQADQQEMAPKTQEETEKKEVEGEEVKQSKNKKKKNKK